MSFNKLKVFRHNSTAGETLSENYLPTLDGWRAVAILGVLIYHGLSPLFEETGPYPNTRLHDLVEYGTLGVPIFFGISGFLICTRLLQQQQRYGCIKLKDFYIRRCCRILPPYLTYLIVLSVIASAKLVTVDRIEWLSCILFFRNYVTPENGGWYTGHFWSLAVEEHFYLIWPLLLALYGAKKGQVLVVTLALLLAAWRVVEYRHQWVVRLLPNAGYSFRTDIRIDGLFWGCWIALLFVNPVWRNCLTKWLSPLVWFIIVGLFVLCLWLQPPLSIMWMSLLIPIILVGTVLRPFSLQGRILEASTLRLIGQLSYSLYIWQQLFLIWNSKYRSAPLARLQSAPLNFFITFACAAVSYYLIERPMIKLGHRLTSRRVNMNVPQTNSLCDVAKQPVHSSLSNL